MAAWQRRPEGSGWQRKRSGGPSGWVALGKLALAVGLVLPAALWSGYAAQSLWRWFVVPFGLPAISVWHAAGLSVLLGFWTMDHRDLVERDEDGVLSRMIVRAVTVPAFALAFGAMYHALG